ILVFLLTDTDCTATYPLCLHDALPILARRLPGNDRGLVEGPVLHSVLVIMTCMVVGTGLAGEAVQAGAALSAESVRRRGCPSLRSEEHTSELQSRENLVCRLLLEKKKV